MDTNVNVRVNLGESEITLKELMALKKGDVIPLDQDSKGEFNVEIEDARIVGFIGADKLLVTLEKLNLN